MIIVMIEAGYRGHSPINSHIIPIISYLVYLHYNSIYTYIHIYIYIYIYIFFFLLVRPWPRRPPGSTRGMRCCGSGSKVILVIVITSITIIITINISLLLLLLLLLLYYGSGSKAQLRLLEVSLLCTRSP